MQLRIFTRVVVAWIATLLCSTIPVSACILRDFDVSTLPAAPRANVGFELIVDYQGSEGCIQSENLTVEPPTLRLEIDCNCVFTATGPVPQQFRSPVVGLPAGSYEMEFIHRYSLTDSFLTASTTLLIGHAPSIPLSPLALTLLALTLAAAAVWVLRR